MFKLVKPAYAQITNPAVPAYGQGDGGQALGGLITSLWRSLILVGGLALLIFMLWGGVSWILAGGDKGKVEAARERIVQAVIGMAVLVATVAIVSFLSEVFQINLLQPEFPTS